MKNYQCTSSKRNIPTPLPSPCWRALGSNSGRMLPSINPPSALPFAARDSAQSDVPSAVQEKYPQSFASNLWMYIPVPISGMGGRKRRLPLPNLVRAHTYGPSSRYSRRRGLVTSCLAFLAVCFVVHVLVNRFGSRTRDWPKFPGDPPTLVFTREDLQRIWKWEVESGHYPSGRKSKFSDYNKSGHAKGAVLLSPRNDRVPTIAVESRSAAFL